MVSFVSFILCISILAPARGATAAITESNYGMVNFNPRSREGSDDENFGTSSGIALFQSSLPRGERRCRRYSVCQCIGHFNPRSREGSDALWVAKQLLCIAFQSSLPRGERPGKRRNIECSDYHFNPRSREGSDSCMYDSPSSPHYFNPRSREGSDHNSIPEDRSCNISILAPARGATISGNLRFCHKQFQSSLPRGERRRSNHSALRNLRNFNPRSREGSDHLLFSVCLIILISILAPARGATDICISVMPSTIFQSSLPRGERHSNYTAPDRWKIISILAPARGATGCRDCSIPCL